MSRVFVPPVDLHIYVDVTFWIHRTWCKHENNKEHECLSYQTVLLLLLHIKSSQPADLLRGSCRKFNLSIVWKLSTRVSTNTRLHNPSLLLFSTGFFFLCGIVEQSQERQLLIKSDCVLIKVFQVQRIKTHLRPRHYLKKVWVLCSPVAVPDTQMDSDCKNSPDDVSVVFCISWHYQHKAFIWQLFFPLLFSRRYSAWWETKVGLYEEPGEPCSCTPVWMSALTLCCCCCCW